MKKKTNVPTPEQDAKSLTSLEDTPLGEIKIHENVISSVVRKVTLSQQGVARLAGSTLMDNIAEIVGSRRMQDRSIVVTMNGDNHVAVEVRVNLKFGYRVPEVSHAIQKGIIEAVEGFTGMTVSSVNVVVQEFEDDDAAEKPAEPEVEIPPII